MPSFLVGLFVVAQVAFPEPLVVNHNMKFPISVKQQETLKLAKTKCKQLYGPQACLKQFTIYKSGHIYAECGLAEEK